MENYFHSFPAAFAPIEFTDQVTQRTFLHTAALHIPECFQEKRKRNPRFRLTKQCALPTSMTITDLEREARAAAAAASSASIAAQHSSADGSLIVLKRDDLDSLLASKPALLIGREFQGAGGGVGGTGVRRVNKQNCVARTFLQGCCCYFS